MFLGPNEITVDTKNIIDVNGLGKISFHFWVIPTIWDSIGVDILEEQLVREMCCHIFPLEEINNPK